MYYRNAADIVEITVPILMAIGAIDTASTILALIGCQSPDNNN